MGTQAPGLRVSHSGSSSSCICKVLKCTLASPTLQTPPPRPAPWPVGASPSPRHWLRAAVTRWQAVQCQAGALPSLSPGAGKYSPTSRDRPQHRSCPRPAGSRLGRCSSPSHTAAPPFRAASQLAAPYTHLFGGFCALFTPVPLPGKTQRDAPRVSSTLKPSLTAPS